MAMSPSSNNADTPGQDSAGSPKLTQFLKNNPLMLSATMVEIPRPTTCFAAGRLDSHYFAPRVAELLARLGKDGRTVRDVAPPRQEKFAAVGTGNLPRNR